MSTDVSDDKRPEMLLYSQSNPHAAGVSTKKRRVAHTFKKVIFGEDGGLIWYLLETLSLVC